MSTKEMTAENRDSVVAARPLALVLAEIVETSAFVAKAGELFVKNLLHDFFRRAEHLGTSHDGQVIKKLHDGFLAVFEDVSNALAFAKSLLHSVAEEPLLVAGEPLTPSIVLHLGSVVLRETSYGEDVLGPDVILLARLESFARPAEVLVSGAACAALSVEQQACLGPSEFVQVKGVPGQVEIRRLAPAAVQETP